MIDFTDCVTYYPDRTYHLHGNKLHRLDGPAVEFLDGGKEWWVFGTRYTEKQFNSIPSDWMNKI